MIFLKKLTKKFPRQKSAFINFLFLSIFEIIHSSFLILHCSYAAMCLCVKPFKAFRFKYFLRKVQSKIFDKKKESPINRFHKKPTSPFNQCSFFHTFTYQTKFKYVRTNHKFFQEYFFIPSW